ncbi:unnamed protein product [Caenorhabditis angaria]|uniref:Uncharacterized protein n=1 Tax=Caenorhabditis angaria TaxID=860376 RepID=A0A9P1IU20_9PELO|nr:unnamed protein product [Caenorhabditis angaria]
MTGFRLGTSNKKDKLSPPGAAKPSALVDEVSESRNFGIKNYLHQFYVTPTGDDLESSAAWYLLPPPPAQRRGLMICRFCTLIGLILLIAGAVSIVVGYTWHPERHPTENIQQIMLYQDEAGYYYFPSDKITYLLQDPMKYWKTAGFCLFASGAVLLAVSLIIPTLAACVGTRRFAAFASADNSPNEPPVRVFPHSGNVQSGPVPVMEEIAKVQPSEKASPSSLTENLLDQQ